MKEVRRIAGTMQGKGFEVQYGYSPPIHIHYIPGTTINYEAETILDNENFTWEEFLNEEEIIQEGKALNSNVINFLQEKDQVELLLRYIVEEAFPYAIKRRSFEVPFIACEIFTYEVDAIMRKFVEDGELMNLFSSFLEPSYLHSTQLVGYFSMVVVCLLLQKMVLLKNLIQFQPATIKPLTDPIGITSIRVVLILLIGADERSYTNNTDVMHWLEDSEVLEMILNKSRSSHSSEIHANATETLCAITRFSFPGLSAKISSPSFIGRLLSQALEDSRPKSVLVNSLPICISYLNPKRSATSLYHAFNRQLNHGSTVSVHPEIVEGMLGFLGNLLRLLDVSSSKKLLLTTYGRLQPLLGKHRLKLVEFIIVLVNVGSQAVEKELVHLEVVPRISRDYKLIKKILEAHGSPSRDGELLVALTVIFFSEMRGSIRVKDWVYVQLQPCKQESVRSVNNHKTSPPYYGSYRILDKIGEMEYKLTLPESSPIHPTFHMSKLKGSTSKGQTVIGESSYPSTEVYVLLRILDSKLAKKHSRTVTRARVQWEKGSPELATWEFLVDLQTKYSDYTLEDNGVSEGRVLMRGRKLMRDDQGSRRVNIEITTGRQRKGAQQQSVITGS